MNICRFSLFIFYIIFLSACSEDSPNPPQNTYPEKTSQGVESTNDIDEIAAPVLTTQKPSPPPIDDKYDTIEWTALIPEDELALLMNPPEYINEVEDGSLEDMIASELQSDLDVDLSDPYQRALVSTNVIPEMNGKLIRLPGFVVPLEFGESEEDITQFFFVPFFGACIHVPPPPPNQIIFVDYPQGIKLTALYDAFWLMGTLKTSMTENDTAVSAYTIVMDSIIPYYE